MNTTVGSQPPAAARRRRRVPWSPFAWGQALSVAGGIPAQLFVFGVILETIRKTRPDFARGFLLWLAVAALIFLISPVLTWVHRHRLRVTAGVEIPPEPARRDLLSLPGLVGTARSQATWRQLCYHVAVAPALGAASVFAVIAWLVSALYAFVYVYAEVLGRDNTLYRNTYGESGGKPVGILLTLIGVTGLFIAPWITSGVRALDIRAARTLLGPSRAEELEHRVEHLTQTRAGVVDAADAERRRLERDLHDGTQQRLVSLAINLGMARAQAGTADEARLAIAEAHEEAKAALAELRDLIRGLHPAVLEDRGLDAALSGIAARMPVPVRLTVDLPRRPAPVIEAVAYFVVSEGLANIVKHAQASEAAVFVQRSGDRLHVIVTDDGVGGADPAGGTGLAGLARRAASVDGAFEIDSPPGGPTLLTVDLPCNR
jgi:signal transduction histidine kinase